MRILNHVGCTKYATHLSVGTRNKSVIGAGGNPPSASTAKQGSKCYYLRRWWMINTIFSCWCSERSTGKEVVAHLVVLNLVLLPSLIQSTKCIFKLSSAVGGAAAYNQGRNYN